jgi:hypothetical protein
VIPRLVQHGELIPDPPPGRICPLCRGPERREDSVPCERCGALLHFPCYWPAALTEAERRGLAVALEADEHAPRRRVQIRSGGRLFEDEVIVGRSAAEDFLNRQIILCSGCRS